MGAPREVIGDDLGVIRSQFAPHRLRMARELAGISQQDLAREVDVTSAAVSQYERGVAIPTSRSIDAFSRRLSVPVAFFSMRDTGTGTPAFFRSVRSTPATERKQARHLTQLVHELTCNLEVDVRLPSVDVPRHPVAAEADNSEAAEAARGLRKDWHVPMGPIDNMVRLAERHGVVIARPLSGHSGIDAFSVPFADRPVIVLSAVKGKKDRSRFGVAHEIGHLVMHDPDQNVSTRVEKQADVFAAEFLMPRDEIEDELPQSADWEELKRLKRRWQVSIQALLYRARDLGRIDEHEYIRAMKAVSARGWRRHEPADLGEPESPVMLDRAIEIAG
ncbi:MAG: helix-turn-helix domain-containing protein, partial [Acidimicrobiales bacterium]